MAFIAFLAILWFGVVPILGLVAFLKTSRIGQLEAKLARLERQLPEGPEKRANEPPKPAATPPADSKPKVPARVFTPPKEKQDENSEPHREERLDAPRPTPSKRTHRENTDWERMIAANWLVWIGGLALALGGLFLVRVAIEAGFFGPTMRTVSAALLGAILTGVSFRAEKWDVVSNATGALRSLPAILAGVGVITLYGSILAAGILYNLLPPPLVLAAFTLTSIWAVALSLRHGPVIAAIGLSGAFVSPFFTGAESGSPIILLPFAAAVTLTGLTLVRLKNWRFLSLMCFAGWMLWGIAGFLSSDPASTWAVPAYTLATGLLAVWIAQSFAHEPFFGKMGADYFDLLKKRGGESVIAAYLIWVGTGLLIVMSSLEGASDSLSMGSAGAFAGLGLLLAWRREGFGLFAPFGALISLLIIALWPDWKSGQLWFSAAAGMGYLGFGALLTPRLRVQAPIAATAALSPPAFLFAAFWRGNAMEPHVLWGIGALVIALAVSFLLMRQKKSDPDFDQHPGAAASYALGASLSASLAPFLVLSDIWLGSAMAVVGLAIAATYQRFPIPTLRMAGMAAAALATILLIRPGMLSDVHLSPVPIFNELSFGFGIAVIALGLGSRFLNADENASRAYEGAAAIIFFAMIGLLIRHAAGNGSINGPFAGLGEASGFAIAYLGMAISLAYRFAQADFVWRGLETVAASVGVGAIGAAWLALFWDEAGNWFVLNLLFAAFAMPAILLGVYSKVLSRNSRRELARSTGWLAVAISFAWINFEVRRTFSGSVIFEGPSTNDIEMWAYSIVWLMYAFCLLGWGVWRSYAPARYASLAVLALALVKVFIFDLGALEGAMRAVSFIALGGALIGTALFYQRFVFARPQPTPRQSGIQSASST